MDQPSEMSRNRLSHPTVGNEPQSVERLNKMLRAVVYLGAQPLMVMSSFHPTGAGEDIIPYIRPTKHNYFCTQLFLNSYKFSGA